MIALIIVGAILLLLLLLLSLRATLTVVYHEELTLSLSVLGIRFVLYPRKHKKGKRSMSAAKAKRIRRKKDEAAAKKAARKKEKKALHAAEHGKKKKKSVRDVLDILSLVTRLAEEIVRRLRKHLKIKVARLKIIVATDDAASTAIAYGAITQSINLLLPILEEVDNFRLPDRDELSVDVDFLRDSPDIELKLAFSLRLWHVFDIDFGALLAYLKYLSAKEQHSHTQG